MAVGSTHLNYLQSTHSWIYYWQMASVHSRNFLCVLCLFAGVAQGVITGVRSLCNGLGPAFFGCIFFIFHVDLNEPTDELGLAALAVNGTAYVPWHARKVRIGLNFMDTFCRNFIMEIFFRISWFRQNSHQ
jgi:hypothetical protein